MRTAGSASTVGGGAVGREAAERDRWPDSATDVLARHVICEGSRFDEFRHELNTLF
jgi:hypothetical protein